MRYHTPDRELNDDYEASDYHCTECGAPMQSHLHSEICDDCIKWNEIQKQAEEDEAERLVELAELEANEKFIFNK